ncbi:MULTISPECIES: VOC family protein [unclassified Bacillus (in: firmicutes)]|uniref:VOC family protein n=1 Tax=unclassified Bacillus (in: firmicutes) TaxID=185979 RepID=UPI0008EF2BD9|nr:MULTISPECIES: VOC family protein [unclassified Bacillus (in: firmicutes)]SFA70155.1 catechol 2,3-dioxygenase [Bacillus sp. UNCCL13]SFQ59708.1 catechol 2,3-dioxygenase [Bacillus sp. cl95]
MNFHQFPATHIGHVHLLVSDLEKSKAFYKETLGLKVLSENAARVEFTADEVKPLLVIEREEDSVPRLPRSTGLFHMAFLVPERKDLAKVLLHLLQLRYPLQGASDHLFSEAIYLADPDGNGIEIYRDRAPEEWVWDGDELPFVSDPIDIEGLLSDARNESWNEFPADTVMGHVHLNVNDLQKAKEFYHDALGFNITVPFRHQALFVGSNGYHHHLGLNTWNGTNAPIPLKNSLGLKLFTIVVPSQEEMAVMVERLQSMDYDVMLENGKAIVKDSAGITVQLTCN